MIWGLERIGTWLDLKLSEKLKTVSVENIVTPPINIAGPTIEAMRFTGDNDELREMYANLLATSMNIDTRDKAHPRFVDIIKNMSNKEAELLAILKKENSGSIILHEFLETGTMMVKTKSYFSEYKRMSLKSFFQFEDYEQLEVYLDNLCHLGILKNINNDRTTSDISTENIIKYYPYIDMEFRCRINASRVTSYFHTENHYISTRLGKLFVNSIVPE